MEPWTIKQLFEAHQRDLSQCQSDFERSNVTAINGREIREKATEWASHRKLTPIEVAIAGKFGYRPA